MLGKLSLCLGERNAGQNDNNPLKGWNCSNIWKQPKQVKIAPTKNYYTITLFNLVVPTCTVWKVILFPETGVVHRIKYSFSYFFWLVVLFTQYILDIK